MVNIINPLSLLGSLSSTALCKHRLEHLPDGPGGQRALVHPGDVPQHERFPLRIEHWPLSAVLDAADDHRQPGALVQEPQQLLVKPVYLLAHGRQRDTHARSDAAHDAAGVDADCGMSDDAGGGFAGAAASVCSASVGNSTLGSASSDRNPKCFRNSIVVA